MGEAPEPGYDLQMTPGIFAGTDVGRPFAQELDSELLIFDILGMPPDRHRCQAG